MTCSDTMLLVNYWASGFGLYLHPLHPSHSGVSIWIRLLSSIGQPAHSITQGDGKRPKMERAWVSERFCTTDLPHQLKLTQLLRERKIHLYLIWRTWLKKQCPPLSAGDMFWDPNGWLKLQIVTSSIYTMSFITMIMHNLKIKHRKKLRTTII